ncbi:hypothetical protein BH23ACT2_BH23ACT2_04790 [soil metagenome]
MEAGRHPPAPHARRADISRARGTSKATLDPSDRRGTIDLAVICVTGVALVAGLSRLRLAEPFAEPAAALSGRHLDAVAALLVFLPLATLVFARRRYQEVNAVRQELVHLSLHDALTGLPNRRLLLDWLATDIARSQQDNHQTAVLFIDLDRFKFVNDTHGHEIGDRLRRPVSSCPSVRGCSRRPVGRPLDCNGSYRTSHRSPSPSTCPLARSPRSISATLVAAALRRAEVAPGQTHLEITEGALMHDVTSAWAVLRRAKALGVKLALDDFGTGYSSLSYVRRFSLDMLKIDKSFIDGIDSSPEDRAIVEHVVAMAEALGMATVGEGAERPEQLAWLRRLGCRMAQGYALHRPMPAPELEVLLRHRRHNPFVIDGVPDPPVKGSGPGTAPAATLGHLRAVPFLPRTGKPEADAAGTPAGPVPVRSSAAIEAMAPAAPGPRVTAPDLPRRREYRSARNV